MKHFRKVACIIAVMTFLLATGCDAFIAKYDSSGNQLWVRQFGTDGDEEGFGVAVGSHGFAVNRRGFAADRHGNIYVAGYTDGSFPGQTSAGEVDAFIAKYDSHGNQRWVRQFGTDRSEDALGVAADRHGNTYVVGYTDGSFPGQTSVGEDDAFIAKYDSYGNQHWVRQFGTDGFERALGVAVALGGNAYVVGYTDGSFPD